MRRFAFKLEKVLELRRYHEREWESRLAEITGRVLDVEREISAWTGRRQATGGTRIPSGRVDMGALHSREDFLILVDERVRILRNRLVALNAERAKVRERYLEVSKRRKALSRLKERRGDDYYRESLHDEHRVLDEIAGSMASRRALESEDDDV